MAKKKYKNIWEAYLLKIKRYSSIASKHGLPYDLIYMLGNKYTLTCGDIDKHVEWGIKTIYGSENEYDDSYDEFVLIYELGSWFLKVYHSDCYYDCKLVKVRKLSEGDVFKLIIKEK